MAWALNKARKFLIGAPRFRVYTDHKPLVTIVNKKRIDEGQNQRLVHQLLKIQDFDFEVEYIKGSDNLIADSLSRYPTQKPDKSDIIEVENANQTVREIRCSNFEAADYPINLQKVAEAASEDIEYRELSRTIIEGFPERKRDLDPLITQYWMNYHYLMMDISYMVLEW